jgi:hypothetical protein
MTNTTMDPYTEQQNRIEKQRQAATADYPEVWRRIIAEWKTSGPADRAWLVYAANYLFSTAGVLWALDPLTLRQRIAGAHKPNCRQDLKELSFILLSHRHKDHLDLEVVRALKDLPIQWVVPESVLGLVEGAGLSKEKIIIPEPFVPVEIRGIQITPFNGLHMVEEPGWPGGLRGVPSTGYLVEFNGKRWLFPGDARNFEPALVPNFGRVDGAFVHLWLGRASALLLQPPKLEAFYQYCLNLQASQLVVAHMQELGRDAKDYWDDRHFELVQKSLQENAAGIRVRSAKMGERVEL